MRKGKSDGSPGTTPCLPPSSRGPGETTPLPRGRAPAGPAPSRAGRPKCPRALAPGGQLPRGRRPRRALRGPRAPRSPEAPARPLLSGERARVPAGSPAAADSIRAWAAEGLAGGRVYQRQTSRPRSPRPAPAPASGTAAAAGGDSTRAAPGRRAAGTGGRRARGNRRGEGRAGPQSPARWGRGVGRRECLPPGASVFPSVKWAWAFGAPAGAHGLRRECGSERREGRRRGRRGPDRRGGSRALR